MIVGRRFEGDDIALSERQSDCYGDALYVIRSVVERRYRAACHLMGKQVPTDTWPGKADHLDHRTIQPLHDQLAAVWRYSVRPSEPFFTVISPPANDSMRTWLSWLRAEMKEWCDEDQEAVRLWVELQQKQNTPQGYEAEDRLLERLNERYADLPWLRPGRSIA